MLLFSELPAAMRRRSDARITRLHTRRREGAGPAPAPVPGPSLGRKDLMDEGPFPVVPFEPKNITLPFSLPELAWNLATNTTSIAEELSGRRLQANTAANAVCRARLNIDFPGGGLQGGTLQFPGVQNGV